MLPIKVFGVNSGSGGGGSYAGGSLDTQTVTSGASGTAVASNRLRGFITGSLGACADGTSNLYAGAAIREIASEEQAGNAGFDVVFVVTGLVANSGWTSMNVGGSNILTRASATYSQGGGNTTWRWALAGNLFASSKVVGFD